MRRVGILIVLPLVLFGLERVNLIKDHSFEKDSEVWHTRVGGSGFPNCLAVVDRNDPLKSYIGSYSGSGDTRPRPEDTWPGYGENTYITQGFLVPKTFEDIDSICVSFAIFPRNEDIYLSYSVPILLHLNAHLTDSWKVGYILKAPNISGGSSPPLVFLKLINFPEDTLWHQLKMNIYKDVEEWTQHQIPLDASLDSVILWCIGTEWDLNWRGQKVFFDDVRLMGYADYDVGIKEILEGIEDTLGYTPEAHIKNFGREPADFAVVAEILQDETQVYYDSLDWSLPADTDDTVSFSTFTPPDTGAYTLRIYTVMEPDESDADDEKTKELHFTAIAEPVTLITHLDLKVNPLTSDDVHVSYSLPQGHTGTLTLFDASGRRVDAKRVRGYGSAEFRNDLSSGIYFIKLEVGGTALSRKIILIE